MNVAFTEKIKWFLYGFFVCVLLVAGLLWWGWPPDEEPPSGVFQGMALGEFSKKYEYNPKDLSKWKVLDL